MAPRVASFQVKAAYEADGLQGNNAVPEPEYKNSVEEPVSIPTQEAKKNEDTVAGAETSSENTKRTAGKHGIVTGTTMEDSFDKSQEIIDKTDSSKHEDEPLATPSTFKTPDVLFCLEVHEAFKADRKFYKDTPWKGINTGLPGSDPDHDKDADAVLTYYVSAEVEGKTEKSPNTPKNWREQTVDFEFGRDAIMQKRLLPHITLHSKKLIGIIGKILDYWPGREEDNEFQAKLIGQDEVFIPLMSCYAELRDYLTRYRDTLPENEQTNPRLATEGCGDEDIAAAMLDHLDFGALDPAKLPCDEQTAYEIAVLLRLLAGMYRVRIVPTWTNIYLGATPRIKFDKLWILFRPGTIVYVKQSAFTDYLDKGPRFDESARSGRPMTWDSKRAKETGQGEEYSACVIARWFYEEADDDAEESYQEVSHLELELWCLQYHGTAFQRTYREAAIETFEGFKPLNELQVVPAILYDKFDNGVLRKRLEQRGNKYLSITREPAAMRTYSHPLKGDDGVVIIDPDAFRQFESEIEHRVTPTKISDGGPGKRLGGLTDIDPATSETFPRLMEVLVLLPRRIEGFVLKTKTWVNFEIEYISDEAPTPTENQLDSELILVSDVDRESLRTVLPKGEHPYGSTPDFVAGKGEGKIFLLYGGPGTGKTLTVECVANDTRRPLLRLTAQDVNINSVAEAWLMRWFTLAAKWDAILLIDEADLFLEQRKEGDLQRNSLSTVFLRLMEYYKGVLFLTTNRPGHIDDSFISRITYPIAYPDLSLETKVKLVQKFVRRFEETDTVVFDGAAVQYLKDNCQDLNGRQIRNILQNAVAAAEVKLRDNRSHAAKMGSKATSASHMVTVKHVNVKTAVERQAEFQRYMQKLRGSEQSRARIKHDYLPILPGIPK